MSHNQPEDVTTRQRGRPCAAVKLEEMVSARLSTTQYQQLCAIAESRDMHVSTLVRELLVFRLR